MFLGIFYLKKQIGLQLFLLGGLLGFLVTLYHDITCPFFRCTSPWRRQKSWGGGDDDYFS